MDCPRLTAQDYSAAQACAIYMGNWTGPIIQLEANGRDPVIKPAEILPCPQLLRVHNL